MAGEVRRLIFTEGVVVTAPFSLSASSGSIIAYDSDATFIANEGTPQEGSVYHNTTTDKLRIYDGSSFDNYPKVRSGVVDLSLGDSSLTVSFDEAWTDTNYVPIISILCDDSNPIFLNWIIQNRTTGGFTIKFNAPVDSDNYKISYHVEGAE